ncbi:MAG: hypothetical protein IJF17_01275 [Thermoguttaceae bacterium]|nr:hypothetical protein [Thermoguttaceae bacterium]
MANFELSIPVQCVPIWIYYGMKTVGKLFFLWGAVFFLVSFGVMEQEVDPEKKSFWMIFVASSAAMAFMGAMMALVSRFMQKPEISKDLPVFLSLAKTVQIFLIVPAVMLTTSLVPLVLFLSFACDWRIWHEVPEMGTFESVEEIPVMMYRSNTGRKSGPQLETPVETKVSSTFHYRFFTVTPEGEKLSFDSWTTRKLDTSVPFLLERSGSVYRIRGTSAKSFYLDDLERMIIAAMLILTICTLAVVLRGILKLHRFCRRVHPLVMGNAAPQR